MKKVKIRQVDTFTETPFSGNPAGVVSSASGLTVKQMKFIAREMNLSTTAFVLPPKTPTADICLRWFTPVSEVDLCGHATIASFHALAEENKYGMTRSGVFKFKVETRSGVLPVEVAITGNSSPLISVGMPIPQLLSVTADSRELGRAFSAEPHIFHTALTPAKDAMNAYIPVDSLENLCTLKPVDAHVITVCRNLDVRGITLFSTETFDAESHVHSRNFTPLTGITENPVTGSSAGPLGIYMLEQGAVKLKNGRATLLAEQGDCLDRAGRVHVEILKMRGTYKSLKISGHAVTVLNGEILLE